MCVLFGVTIDPFNQEVKEEKPVKVQMTMEDFSCVAVLGRGSFGKVKNK